MFQEHLSGFSAIPLVTWLGTMTSPWPELWPCANDALARDFGVCQTQDVIVLLESAKCWHLPRCLGIPIALLSVTVILCWDVLERHVGLLRAGQNHHPSGMWPLVQPQRRAQLVGDLPPPPKSPLLKHSFALKIPV